MMNKPIAALPGALLVAAVVSCGGGEKKMGPSMCGVSMCTERQVCDSSSSPPQCKCTPDRTGPDCSACARGYTATTDGRCLPFAVDCRTNPGVCGVGGTCATGTAGGPDSCLCKRGFAGNTCQTCADGFQDNDHNGTCLASCSMTTCQGQQTCMDSTGSARCACPGNRVGANCDQCPAGWVLRTSDNVCIQTCASAGTICGTNKMCDPGQGICICRPEYTGDRCDTCAAGYQDNNGDRVCSRSCASTTCAAGQTCSDTTGTAVCACPGNHTGANCDQCPSGWVLRAADGTCVQTCASMTTSCGARRYCDDAQGTPVCACQAGYTGSDCSLCAADYMADGAGMCVRTAPAGTTLLASGRYQNADYLLAIDPAAGTATPLRPLAGLSSLRLTSDFAGRTIYTASTTALSRIEAATGKLVPVAMIPSIGAAAFGAGGLFTLGPLSPYLLKRVDPASGAVADIGPTNLGTSAGSVGLTWEAGGTLLYARPPATLTNGADLIRIDPATAAMTTLGSLTVEAARLRPGDNRVGVAFDSTGKLFLATHLGRPPEELVTEHCRKLAAGLGYPGYETAPLTTLEINYNGIGAGLTRTLASQNASGKEIIAYASYGRRTNAKAFLRVQTANPDAFVCVSSYEEVLELQIAPSTARFTAIALTGSRPTLTLAVEGAVPPVTRPTLHVFASTTTYVSTAFDGGAGGYQFSKLYKSTEWTALRLPTYVSAWDTDSAAPSVLLQVDLASRTIARVLSFAGVELYPALATWAP